MSWQLTAADLPDLARGATLLGTGGGGDPYIGKMLVERVLGEGSITILDPGCVAKTYPGYWAALAALGVALET